ncbi:MAG: hypothetical protein AB7F86_12510 [Bdellovibrionales bacterium]
MRDALVFNGASNLDFQEVRSNVIRIPEVLLRVREAQIIWDKMSGLPMDLATFIASEDSVFLGHIRLRSFANAVVQVGLLDRYLKNYRLPEFIVGAINGDSPLKVAAGQMTFAQMIEQSPCVSNQATRSLKPIPGSGLEMPVLAGIQLVEYGIVRRSEQGYVPVDVKNKDIEKMVVEIVEGHDLERLVVIGPGHSIFGRKMRDLTARDVQVLESIELDPMLTWFWSLLNEDRLAVAN